MRIENVEIGSLTPDPENARRHPQKNLDALMGSIRLFGQRRPLVVWGKIVIAGNGTLAAMKALGETHVFISRVPPSWDYLQARAFALADNRTAELAEWSPDTLADQLLELDSVGWDVSDFGFAALEPPTNPEPLPDTVSDFVCPTCGRFT